MASDPLENPVGTLKEDLQEAWKLLRDFGRKPTLVMRQVPDWPFRRTLLVLLSTSLVIGLGRGVARLSVVAVLLEPILSSIAAIATVGVFGFIAFYTVKTLSKSAPNQGKLFLTLSLAYIPFGLTRIFEISAWPFELIGVAGSFLLLIVGLSENFYLPKKHLTRVFGGFYLVILTYWIGQTILESRNQYLLEKTSSPIDIEDIEKDLSQSD